jgi:hypothetical protein
MTLKNALNAARAALGELTPGSRYTCRCVNKLAQAALSYQNAWRATAK